ncbi:MAG: helix-turn-helix domain-containing protein [Desulfitobacteriaceae bacterium]|nr:helix-turn-helix domain-containing protein [Desulfitobacteriaceae bacterium]
MCFSVLCNLSSAFCGCGDFVAQVIRNKDELEKKRLEKRIPIEKIIDEIAIYFDIERNQLISSRRQKKVSMARSLISFFAVEMMRFSRADVAKALNISRASVSKALVRGKELVDCDQNLMNLIA